MARKTPNRLIITWDGIKNKTCASVIENYLKLRTPLPTYDLPEVETKKAIDNAMAEKANDYYEKTLYYLTNLSKTGR